MSEQLYGVWGLSAQQAYPVSHVANAVEAAPAGVDTPEDLERLKRIMEGQ